MSTDNCIHRGLIEEQEYVDMQLIIAPFFRKNNYITENNLYPQHHFNRTLDHALL